MGTRKVGVIIDSFRIGVKPGIEKAAALGADGFQIYVTGGEMAPENMSSADRRAFVKFAHDCGLTISALCADFGKGFLNTQTNPAVIKRTKACIDLAVDLGTSVVTTHIGHLPDDRKDLRYLACAEAVLELGNYAFARGISLATETGPESPEHLAEFLKLVNSPGAKVNYDPANLVMNGFDQLGGVKVLSEYIVHTHAKDGIRKDGVIEEVPLGEGQVDFPVYLSKLDGIGYEGFLTIEREVGPDPESDIRKAIGFLRTL